MCVCVNPTIALVVAVGADRESVCNNVMPANLECTQSTSCIVIIKTQFIYSNHKSQSFHRSRHFTVFLWRDFGEKGSRMNREGRN